MSRPLVAVTTYPADEGGRVGLPVEYVHAVRRGGGTPVLVAPGDADPDDLLKRVDALVLAGGGDLDPATYGAPTHDSVYQTDHERDRTELDLARRAVETSIPTLAICRGLQVLNVALGGTLHVHLPDVVGEQVLHRAPPREPIPHPVAVDEGTRVASAMGTTEVAPMSWHHQAADRLGDGLCPVARAADGVVEALELDGHPWMVAVQWHPELTAASDPSQQGLFDRLVTTARAGS